MGGLSVVEKGTNLRRFFQDEGNSPSLFIMALRDANIGHSPTQILLSKFTLIIIHM